MSTTPQQPSDRLNANQFDEEGLPGIDPDYPPEQAWAVDDPALVNGGSETPDDLRTRVAREEASALGDDAAREVPPLVEPDSGDPAVPGDLVDDEATVAVDTGRADPDAPPTAEEAAMHVIRQP